MAKKSQLRRDRDAAERATNPGRRITATASRMISSRSWYELKQVHERSAENVAKIARLMAQYNDPLVLVKIADNGDAPRFKELHQSIPGHMAIKGKEFQELNDSHKDRKGAATSVKDVQEAMAIFDNYQRFDMSLLEIFKPIIDELCEIYNKAMKDLADIQEQVRIAHEKAPMDVEFKEIPAVEETA